MSQVQPQPQPQLPPQAYVPVQPQVMVMPTPRYNGLGMFAFFVALIGLFIPTGIVAILGLDLSLPAVSAKFGKSENKGSAHEG